jgi:hypothetical protein
MRVLRPNKWVYWTNKLQKYHTTKCNTHFRIFFYSQLVILGCWLLTWLLWFLPRLAWTIAVCQLTLLRQSQSQSQSHIAIDGQSISKSWCRAPSGAHDQIFITFWQLRSYFCGAPSLTRGRVCLLFMLLALSSAVFLGSESLGTSVHILRSKICNFPFRRLLILAGSRWRYSSARAHGLV